MFRITKLWLTKRFFVTLSGLPTSFISTSFLWGLACITLLVVINDKSCQHILSLTPHSNTNEVFADLQAHPPFCILFAERGAQRLQPLLPGYDIERTKSRVLIGCMLTTAILSHLLQSYVHMLVRRHTIPKFTQAIKFLFLLPFFVPAYNDLPIVPCIIYIYIYIYIYVCVYRCVLLFMLAFIIIDE